MICWSRWPVLPMVRCPRPFYNRSDPYHSVSSPTFSVYTPRSLTPDRNQVVPLASYCPTMPPAPSATPFHDSSYATSLGAPISASPSSLPSFSWAHQTSTSFTGGSQNPFLLPQDTEHEGKSDTWVSVCQQSPRQVEDQSTVDQNPLVLRPRTDTSFDLDSLNATEDSLGHRMVGSAAPTHKKRHLHKVRGRRGTGILKPMQRPSTQSLRYLRQNDCDEEMHIILDCITPYYNHCFRGGKWKLGADYLYDEFTQYIGLAIVSFSQAGPRGFGFALQQAFISLEPLILNESLWGLERIFYAVSGLTASGFMDVVQSLLTHSCNLASGKFERLHPMIQILKRFAVLSDKDPAFFAHSILTVWRLCHSIMNTDKVNSILLFHNRKCFWKDIRNWPAEEQTTRNLRLFLEKVEKDFGEYNDIAMVIYDELVAIDSQFHRDKLEQTALEMLRRARVRLRHGKLSGELVSWYRNANYELAWFYYSSGKIQSAIEHLRQVIPDRTETRWESDQFDILQGWLMES
jgi:hypothetical protein